MLRGLDYVRITNVQCVATRRLLPSPSYSYLRGRESLDNLAMGQGWQVPRTDQAIIPRNRLGCVPGQGVDQD